MGQIFFNLFRLATLTENQFINDNSSTSLIVKRQWNLKRFLSHFHLRRVTGQPGRSSSSSVPRPSKNAFYNLKICAENRIWFYAGIHFFYSYNQRHFYSFIENYSSSVAWDCRIHWLNPCRGVRPSPNESPDYNTKQSDSEILVMLELWGMQNSPLVPLLPGPLEPGVVTPDRVLSMGPIKLFNIHTVKTNYLW